MTPIRGSLAVFLLLAGRPVLPAAPAAGWSAAIAHHSGANRTGFRSFSQFSASRGSGLAILANGTQGDELWKRLVATSGDL